MDLGLAGAKALVQGGTKGMGRAAADVSAHSTKRQTAGLVTSRRNSYMTGSNINVDGGLDFT